jgi:hypothetical protein
VSGNSKKKQGSNFLLHAKQKKNVRQITPKKKDIKRFAVLASYLC